MKYVNFLVLISLLLTLNLSAKTYENGEDKKINRWETLASSSSAIIKNIYDKSQKSRVINFSGNGTKDAYILMINEHKNKKKFHWDMKYSEDFVIFISLDTKLGKRYLIYTPGSKNAYMQYGLGSKSKSGTWQKYTRNLEDDLRYFDNRNSIIKVNSFVIRGSGAVDNIEIIEKNNTKVQKKIKKKHSKIKKKHARSKKKHARSKKKHARSKQKYSKPRKKHLKVENKDCSNSKKRNLKSVEKSNNDKAPTIIIKGENPYYLPLGQAFEEPGVRAEDEEDGELIVTSSEDIDKHREGTYLVIYMATDSNGNSAIDKREVVVGNVGRADTNQEAREPREERVERREEPKESSQKEEDSEEQYRIEERELEISEWEKELQLREQELSQREKSMTQ